MEGEPSKLAQAQRLHDADPQKFWDMVEIARLKTYEEVGLGPEAAAILAVASSTPASQRGPAHWGGYQPGDTVRIVTKGHYAFGRTGELEVRHGNANHPFCVLVGPGESPIVSLADIEPVMLGARPPIGEVLMPTVPVRFDTVPEAATAVPVSCLIAAGCSFSTTCRKGSASAS